MSEVFIDSFSGGIMQLDKKDRAELNALSALQNDPKISTFDMNEEWKDGQEVYEFIGLLIQKELITEEKNSYPWHRYNLTKKGERFLTKEE